MTTRLCLSLGAALALAACSALPDKPTRPVAYDFGSSVSAVVSAQTVTAQAPIALGDIETAGVSDTAAVSYRLQYSDAQQLRPYAMARWTLPPAQLVRQRVREVLAERRPIVDVDDLLAQQRTEGRRPRLLRLQLEEFSQVFASPGQSEGVLRLRATLVENTPLGDSFVGQRLFAVRQPAASADAAGGVQALAAATDAAAAQIDAWLVQLAPTGMVKP
ncbi:hypothetical protein GT347_14365 [Xylophilus rhododendri]|uniref:ABC-type transport auxiliary lipoprotein component domain-containing protein n=1 Tax=Xylophilus rhododendri TaxID=2697032 RepID=A0A857J509_9BURK|nr:ABC-type transport auxiliary lipoprotein family protein [Xylophilus rhododendri]QHI99064.1 hypothetical protein GT347_14365 [Xylophilus rhododendri]